MIKTSVKSTVYFRSIIKHIILKEKQINRDNDIYSRLRLNRESWAASDRLRLVDQWEDPVLFTLMEHRYGIMENNTL